VFGAGVVSALRQRPLGTVLGYLGSTALKLAFVDEMASYYERTRHEDQRDR